MTDGTNPAPAPQPDLRQRIAEMFPCICVPRFEDGAHWHDCPTHFREAVEALVNECVEAETAAAYRYMLKCQEDERAGWVAKLAAETAALRAKVAVDRQHICETLEEIDTAMGKDRDFAKAIAARVLLLERARDEARRQVERLEKEKNGEMQKERDALRAQRDSADQKIDELNLRLVGARRERDEAREKLARAQSCEESWRREWREGKNAPEKRQHQLFGKLEAAGELECALGAESPRKDAADA